MPMRAVKWVLVVAVLAGLLAAVRQAAGFLVVNQPARADVLLVLGGDHNDVRYWAGLRLLQQGQAPLMLIDENTDEMAYGRTPAQLEQEFIDRTAGPQRQAIRICTIQAHSTEAETADIELCLHAAGARTVLIVTSEFHTRRALSILRQRLPQYQWFIAAAPDESQFSTAWWRKREWAKTTLTEWLKLIWWHAVDRWR